MTERYLIPSAAVAIVTALSCPLVGQAEILTFAMEGTVSILGSDPPGLPSPAGAVGDRAVYAFSFDSNVPPLFDTGTSARYPAVSASLRVGGLVVACQPPTIDISHPLDAFEVKSAIGPPAPEVTRGYVFFRLGDQAESNALVDHSLPTEPYDLAAFDLAYFQLNLFAPAIPPSPYETWFFLYGDIDSFYVVPEPGGLIVFVLAVAVAFVPRPRRVY